MSLKDLLGEYGFVAKVDVSDLDKSTTWYADKLGLIPAQVYSTPTWRQLDMPDISSVAIGLNLNPQGVGACAAVSTFLVDNIENARNNLINEGVDVGGIEDVGDGVKLCFFKDPDSNPLCLRQNSSV